MKLLNDMAAGVQFVEVKEDPILQKIFGKPQSLKLPAAPKQAQLLTADTAGTYCFITV